MSPLVQCLYAIEINEFEYVIELMLALNAYTYIDR